MIFFDFCKQLFNFIVVNSVFNKNIITCIYINI
jgi:hypothetical protein